MSEPAWQLVQTEPPVRVDPELRLWMGGPVEPQRTWVLMAEAQGPDEEQREICPGVLLSVSHALTLELPADAVVSRACDRRLCGMGARAARQGARRVRVADQRCRPLADLWGATGRHVETAIRRLGTDPAALQSSSGVH